MFKNCGRMRRKKHYNRSLPNWGAAPSSPKVGAQLACVPRKSSGPPGFDRRIAENDAGKESDGRLQAFVNRGEGVFVFDADDVIVPGQTKGAYDLLPYESVMAPADRA